MELNPQDREQALVSRRSIELSYDPEKGVREDGDKRYVTFTAASDRPLVRNMFFGPVRETLHFDGLDTKRLKGGHVKLLDTHKSGSIYDQLGNISDFRIKKGSSSQGDTVLEVEAEFDISRDKQRDAFDGILAKSYSNVSVGYSDLGPGGMKAKWNDGRADYDPDKDVVGEIDYVRWEINEISLCSVPADAEIGLGRSGGANAVHRIELAYARHREELRTRAEETDKITPNSSNQSDTRSNNMSEQTEIKEEAKQAAEPAGERVAEQPEAKAEAAPERKFDSSGQAYLAREALSIAKRGHSEDFIRELAERAGKDEGMSESEVKSALFDERAAQDEQMNDIGSRAPATHFNTKDRDTFNAARLAKGIALGRVDSIEGDKLQDWQRTHSENAPGNLQVMSAYAAALPTRLLLEDPAVLTELAKRTQDEECRKHLHEAIRTSYSVGSTPSGFFHEVFDESFLIKALTPKSVFLYDLNKWGMTLTQDLNVVIETGVAGVGDVNPTAETATRAETSGPSYANHTYSWHEMYARMPVSTRTLDQSNYFASRLVATMQEGWIRGANIRALQGTGTNGQPTGIMVASGTNPVTLAAVSSNNVKLEYEHLVEMRQAVKAANGYTETAKYYTTPEVEGKIQRTPRFTASTGSAADRILSEPKGDSVKLDGYDFKVDNNIHKSWTIGGTDTANRHGLIFGDASTIDFVTFAGMTLVRDDLTKLETGQVVFHLRGAYDILARQTAQFAVTNLVDPTA